MNNKLVYVASPLTHSDPAIRQKRFEAVRDYIGKKYKEGNQNMHFSPILYSYEIGQLFTLPHTANFWENIDHVILSKCDKLEILTIEGWDTSVGVQMEMAYWNTLPGQRPIFYVPSDSGK